MHKLIIKTECGEENLNFILKFNSYYITSRYGPAIDELTKSFKKKQAEDICIKTGEFINWLKSKLS